MISTGTGEAAPAGGPAGDPAGRELLVELRDVTVEFGSSGGFLGRSKRSVRAVDGVDFLIRRGENVGLVGGTGSGKSTIAHVITGLVQATSGSVRIPGQEGSGGRRGKRTRRAQVVFQDPFSSLDPRMTVADIIAEPLTLGRLGRRSKAINERVRELLGMVGLPAAKARLFPHQFSGGQRQRIAIARALASDPELIVLDEPTSALDVSVRAQILRLLEDLNKRLGVTYLIISHDLVTVAYLAAVVQVMYLGRIVEAGPARQLYRAPRHPYTKLLLDSSPDAAGDFLRLAQQPGPTTRDPVPGEGCRYAPRCPLRAALGNPDRCTTEDPALRPIDAGQTVACHFSERLGELP